MKVIDQKNLHDHDFIGVQTGSKVDVRVKIANKSSNLLRSTPEGLEVTGVPNIETIFITDFVTGSRRWSNDQSAYVAFQGKLGLIKLDFTKSNNTNHVANLPPNCPIPINLVEHQIIYPDNTIGSVWIDGGSRAVMSNNIKTNMRHIINMSTFFNR